MASKLLGRTNVRLVRSSSCRLFQTTSIPLQQHALAKDDGVVQNASENTVLRSTHTNSSRIKYTAEKYPLLKRDSRFKQISAGDVRFFENVLGKNAVVDGSASGTSSDLDGFNVDWTNKFRGQSKLIIKPSSTEEVSEVVRYCNQRMLALNPQGGNTGLVGGSVPVFDEIVLNLSRLNRIRSFEETSGVLVADAGVILQDADEYVKQRGCIFPLDLGAKGSCQIGGNVSTNAGGLRLLRYGSLHGTVLGLEIVLPDGTIVNDLSTLRKDNTGYDVKQLFIGSEGTIGIITAISILCPPRASAKNVAYFGLDSYSKVQHAFREAKHHLSEILSAFELMDLQSQCAYKHATGDRLPLADEHPFYCVIETSGSNEEHDSEKLNAFLQHVMDNGIARDGVVAQDESQAQALWACREGVSEASQHFGAVYKYDFSLPLTDLYKIIEDTRKRVQQLGLVGDTDDFPIVDIVGYGHMGDSNIHMNVVSRRYDSTVESALEPFVYDWVARHSGSISAEHGLGLTKKRYVSFSKSEGTIRLMRNIKQSFDPKGIMNPYKYI